MWAGRYWGGRYFGGRYWGKVGLTVPGYFWGSRYFGTRYWGLRYWGKAETSVPFEVTQTNTLSLTGALLTSTAGIAFGADFPVTQTAAIGLSSSLSLNTSGISFAGEVWPFTAPLEVGPLVGTLTIAGTVTIVAPTGGSYWGRRYWGGVYFAPRYWGAPDAFAITQTTGASLSGGLTTAATIGTTIGTSFSTLGLTGLLGVAADVQFSSGPAESSGGGIPQAWVMRELRRRIEEKQAEEEARETEEAKQEAVKKPAAKKKVPEVIAPAVVEPLPTVDLPPMVRARLDDWIKTWDVRLTPMAQNELLGAMASALAVMPQANFAPILDQLSLLTEMQQREADRRAQDDEFMMM